MNVVITTLNFTETALSKLKEAGLNAWKYSGPALGAGVSEDILYEAVKDADIIIAGTETYSSSLLKRLHKLKLISRNGIGYDAIDLKALKELGIGLTRTTGFVEGAVAEHVMAYILYFARRIDAQNKSMHEHVWKPTLEPGAKGKTLALYGFGGIGKEIAKRAVPFKMNVIYYCRHPNLKDEKTYGVKYVDEETLLREGDFLSLNVPLTDSTFHLIDKNKLDQMKTGSILINIARGPVIDEFAVTDALKSGKLGAAAVDVFPTEPCTNSPLAGCPTAVLTPHTASSTIENSAEMNIAAVDNVLNYLQRSLDDKYLVLKGVR